MPRIYLLGSIICLLGSVGGTDIPVAKVKGIQTVTIPPLSPNRDNPISISVSLGETADFTFIVRYRRNIDDSFTDFYNEQGKSNRIERVVNFPKELVTTGTTYFFVIVRSDVFEDNSVSKIFESSKIVSAKISLSDNYVESFLTEKNYTSYSLLKDGVTKYYPESFTFSNFQKEQEQSYYNYLDINKFCFTYYCNPNSTFTYKECYMYLQNYKNWFDNIGTTYGNFRKIPLNIVKDGKSYHFQLTDPIYVNKASNRLFSTYQENCFQTKTLYLPKNGYSKDTIQMNLNIKGVGFNESSISQTFLFSVNSNYFGDCYNSEYCISASGSETNFEYGEVEEH